MNFDTQGGVEQFSQNTMPAAKRQKTTRTKARASRKNQLTPVQRNKPYASKGTGPLWDPFPAQAIARMTYSEVITLQPAAAGLVSFNLFRANSIFDPNMSGVGHQPYGHDVYEQIYNHYRVLSATCTLRPTVGGNCIYGIALSDDTSVELDYDTVREMKTSRYASMMNNGGPLYGVTQYYGEKQVFDGRTADTQALFGQNPADQQFFHIWKTEKDKNTNPSSTSFMLTITYTVRMSELKALGQS